MTTDLSLEIQMHGFDFWKDFVSFLGEIPQKLASSSPFKEVYYFGETDNMADALLDYREIKLDNSYIDKLKAIGNPKYIVIIEK